VRDINNKANWQSQTDVSKIIQTWAIVAKEKVQLKNTNGLQLLVLVLVTFIK
jgi:hypothetical protein